MPLRRPNTEEEKQRKREAMQRWWAEHPEEREVRRQRRIEYNKTRVFSDAARKKASEHLTQLNKTRPHSAEERRQLSERMSRQHKDGIMGRGPLTEAEKELHRQRMITDNLSGKMGRKSPMSAEERKAHSLRMQTSNPMHTPEVAAKVGQTRSRLYHDQLSEAAKQRRAEGILLRHSPLSEAEKRAHSERMKANNPMKRPEVVRKVQETRHHNGANQRTGDRLRQMWAEGLIAPRQYGRDINKTEARLLVAIQPLGFRFTGDGTFWLRTTRSGISRNPDFIWQSGRKKVALLLNGVYWHTKLAADPELELSDYRAAGWKVFVLWVTNHLSFWMIPSIVTEITQWLNGIELHRSKMPDIHQFSTLNASLTTIS